MHIHLVRAQLQLLQQLLRAIEEHRLCLCPGMLHGTGNPAVLRYTQPYTSSPLVIPLSGYLRITPVSANGTIVLTTDVCADWRMTLCGPHSAEHEVLLRAVCNFL